MTVDKVIAKIIWPRFFGPPCRLQHINDVNDHADH